MHFKDGFIHFDRRILSFGAILSDCFHHFIIVEKIESFAENSEKGAIWFCSYIHENRVPYQSLGVQNKPLGWATKMGGKRVGQA